MIDEIPWSADAELTEAPGAVVGGQRAGEVLLAPRRGGPDDLAAAQLELDALDVDARRGAADGRAQDAVDAVLVARAASSNLERARPSPQERAAHRAAQRDTAVEVVTRYNPDAVVCVGVPFGHTRPQWILPHGGAITVDGAARRVFADYS